LDVNLSRFLSGHERVYIKDIIHCSAKPKTHSCKPNEHTDWAVQEWET